MISDTASSPAGSSRSQQDCGRPKRESARRNSRRDHCAYHGALLGFGASLKPIQSVTSNHLVRFRSTSPRKNLPPSISRKRAEANFLCSFERVFVAGHCQTKQITWRDFALQGYGIPDLITFSWSIHQNQATVLSLEALRHKLLRQHLTAFELKLRDWRKGIVQALPIPVLLRPLNRCPSR